MFSDTHDRHDLASNIAVTALFTLIVVLVATDLAFDVRSGTTGAHAAIEGLIIAAGLAGAVRFAKKVRELGREARELRRRTRDLGTRLDASQAEAAGVATRRGCSPG